MRVALLAMTLLTSAVPLVAQDFTPPAEDESPPTSVRIGLFGFSSKLGVDFRGINQAIASIAIDVADVYSDRVRLRPSFEIGAGSGVASYVGNIEMMYRFLPDTEQAVPYIGFGLGIYGQTGCGPAPGCPKLMPQFALGFELKFQNNMNWLIEYHGEDALRRHRFFVGLATRRS